MTKYKDFDNDKMRELRDTIIPILEERGTVYNHELAEDILNVEDFGWNTKSTFKMALSKLRDKLEQEGVIAVEVEDTTSVAKKKEWRKTTEQVKTEAGNR